MCVLSMMSSNAVLCSLGKVTFIYSALCLYVYIYLRIKSLFFYLHDVMKTVGGAKIP